MKRLALLLTFFPIIAAGQATRIDIPMLTSGPNIPVSGGALPQTLWVSYPTIYVCTHPSTTLAACQASPLTTYTDATEGTTCPPTAPIVNLPGNTCSANGGALGNLGIWYQGGTFDYWVTDAYGSYGPYTDSGVAAGGGIYPTNCSAYSSLGVCLSSLALSTTAVTGAALFNPTASGTWSQPTASTATAGCIVNPVAGTVSIYPLYVGFNYTGTTVAVTATVKGGQPAGATIGTVTGNVVSGQVTSYTITGANSGFGNGINQDGCPLTLAVTAPPASVVPISVARLNNGTQAYGAFVDVDDFGCVHDGVTDDTACIQNWLNYISANSTRVSKGVMGSHEQYYVGTANNTYQAAHDDGTIPVAAVFNCTATAGVPNSPCTLNSGTYQNGYSLATTTVEYAPIGTGYVTATNLPTTTTNATGGAGTGTGATVDIVAVNGAIASCIINNGGTGYVQYDVLIPTQTGSSGGQCNASVVTGGVVTTTVTVGNQRVAFVPTAVACSSPTCPANAKGNYISALTLSGGTGYPSTFQVYVGPTCQFVPCQWKTPLNQLVPYAINLPNFVTIEGNNATIVGPFTTTYATAVNYPSNTWPYGAIFGSQVIGGFGHVKINNLKVANAFMAFGNIGGINTFSRINCYFCMVPFQGQNVQFDKVEDFGYLSQDGSAAIGYFGGMYADRSVFTGINSGSIENAYNLVDSLTFNRLILYSFGGFSTVQAWQVGRRALDCWFADNMYRPQDIGIFNNDNCAGAPSGYAPRSTDQDISQYAGTNMWHGIFGVALAMYGVYARPMLSVVVNDLQIKGTNNYAVIMGPGEGNGQFSVFGSEAAGTCAGAANLPWGGKDCPNPYEPQNKGLASMVLLSNGSTNIQNIGTSSANGGIVGFPWTQMPNGSTGYYKQSLPVLQQSGQSNTGVNAPVMPVGSTNDTVLQGNQNHLFQANGGKIQTDSDLITLVSEKYNAAGFQYANWTQYIHNSIGGPTPNITSTPSVYEMKAWNNDGSTGPALSGYVKMPGLRVNGNDMQNGAVSGFTVTYPGSGYLPNNAVPCTVSNSPVHTPGSVSLYYQSDCMGKTNQNGQVTLVTCSRCGQQYANGTVQSLAILTAGSGQTPGTYYVGTTGGGGTGAVASIVVAAGGTVVATPTIVNPGTGYTSTPTFTLVSGGTPATFTPTLSATPTVTMNGPVFYAKTGVLVASTTVLTVNATTLPQVGDNVILRGNSSPFGLALNTYTASTPLVVASTGSGYFTANYSSAGTFQVATATAYSITSNVATITASNVFNVGDTVLLNGFTTGTYFNGQTVTVTAIDTANIPAHFYQFAFTNPNVGVTADTGTSTRQTNFDIGTATYPNDSGSTATATATIQSTDGEDALEHLATCSFILNAGGTVAAYSTTTLAGITCVGAQFTAQKAQQDFVTPISIGGTVNNMAGLIVTGYVTGANTITVQMQNPTATGIAYPAGGSTLPYIMRLENGDAALDEYAPMSIPTITSSGTVFGQPLSNAVTTATGGTGTGTVTCLTTTCTNLRGSYSVATGTFTTGTFLTLVWPTTTIAYNCTAVQNGLATQYGIGHSVATATGVSFTNATSFGGGAGITYSIDYECGRP